MPHPAIENDTPYAFEPVFAQDEEGRPVLVAVVKGTFAIPATGRATLAEAQEPIRVAGVWWGKPGGSSLRYEPEVALEKPATDVVLIGTVQPAARGEASLEVGIRLGPVQKTARVFGRRVWRRRFGLTSISKPEPLEPVPLRAEHAFGGWDRSTVDERHHRCEPRNPVGVGFHSGKGAFQEDSPLPRIELPHALLKRWGQSVEPATFGFTEAHWEPRRRFAGTYDARWERARKPRLPEDFDRRFFNAASPGLVAPGRLAGNEPVQLLHLAGRAHWGFELPGVAPPALRVVRHRAADAALQSVLDTVVVDADAERLELTWRAHLVLREGPPDVARIAIDASDA